MHISDQLDRAWLLAISRPPFVGLQDHRSLVCAPVMAPEHHGVLAFNAVARTFDAVRLDRLQHFVMLKE